MTVDTRPAIRWENFMGDREDYERIHLIGPYETVAARNRDLHRLAALPLGDRRFRGGQLFWEATMAEAAGQKGWDYEIVPPEQVANAISMRSFHALYSGHDDAPEPGDDDWTEPVVDPYELHPDQTALFR
jgi:hypothetical protein